MSVADAAVKVDPMFHCLYQFKHGVYVPHSSGVDLEKLIVKIESGYGTADSIGANFVVDQEGKVHYHTYFRTTAALARGDLTPERGTLVPVIETDPNKHKQMAPYTFFRYAGDGIRVPVVLVFDPAELREVAREYTFARKRFIIKNQYGDNYTV